MNAESSPSFDLVNLWSCPPTASLPDVIHNSQNETQMTSPAQGSIISHSKAFRRPNWKSWTVFPLMTGILLAGCHSSDRLPSNNSKAYSDYLSTFYVSL